MVRELSKASIVSDVCNRTVFNKLNQEELAEKIAEIKTFDRACVIGFDFSDLDFCGFNLDDVEFNQCILDGSCFDGASLDGASFVNCLVDRASFRGTVMNRARIEDSNFDLCNFSGCLMTNVSLKSSSFFGSNFAGAVLIPSVVSTDTDFDKAKMNCVEYIDSRTLSYTKSIPYFPMTCPDSGAFIGWKKCRDITIVKLLIPEDAKRSSATGRKCRCDKAVVLELQDLSGRKLSDDVVAYSNYDSDFEYRVGETITVDDFCDDRWEECAPGIHFFINRQEAVEYW